MQKVYYLFAHANVCIIIMSFFQPYYIVYIDKECKFADENTDVW